MHTLLARFVRKFCWKQFVAWHRIQPRYLATESLLAEDEVWTRFLEIEKRYDEGAQRHALRAELVVEDDLLDLENGESIFTIRLGIFTAGVETISLFFPLGGNASGVFYLKTESSGSETPSYKEMDIEQLLPFLDAAIELLVFPSLENESESEMSL